MDNLTRPCSITSWRGLTRRDFLQIGTLGAAGLSLAALAKAGDAASGDAAWRKVENRAFSFSLPPSLKKTEGRGTDSMVEEYVGESIRVSFDYGWYSNNFGEWPKETKFEEVKVNGKAARIGTVASEMSKGFPFSTQIHFQLDAKMRLSMFAACKSEKEVAQARKIFESIVFSAKKD